VDRDSTADEQARTDLARFAERIGVQFSDDELADLAPKVSQNRADLERLRTTIQPDEEPAHIFTRQVGTRQVGTKQVGARQVDRSRS
jgi:hypothetical protein